MSFLDDLGTGIGNFVSGTTNVLSGGKNKEASELSKEGIEAWQGIQAPDLADLQVQLEDAIYNGDVTVEQAQQILQQQSELKGITLDPKFKEAQMNALQSLQDIGQNKGLTDMDRAQLYKIGSQEAAQQRGSREAILQNAQARGLGGSGLELMSQLQNQQSSADRQAMRDTDVAGMAQQRALQALQGAGQLGTQYGNQSFDQQAQVAGAQDKINQFNAQTGNEMNKFNTAATNAGNLWNANTQQDIANANTNIHNTQSQLNAGAVQQGFQNQATIAGGKSGAAGTAANTAANLGGNNQKVIGGMIESGAKAYAASDERVKENVEEFNPSDFLNNLTSYKYTYKEPSKHGQGVQVGVMAKDIEKSAPQAVVVDSDGVKRVDYEKLGGPILASLADMNRKIKDLKGK